MFDGLKDKLSSFREDAEEAAEENAEPVEEGEEPADSAEADEESTEPADAETPADLAEAGAAESEEAAEPTDEEATAGDAADVDAPADADSPADLEADASTDVESGPATDAEEPREADRDDASGPDADAGPEADAEQSDESEDEQAEDADESASTGFARKAKSMVKGKFVIEEEDLEGPLQDLEMALLASDVEMSVADALSERLREELVGETRTFTTSTGAVVDDALRSALLEVVGVGQFDFDARIAEAEKPIVITFTGVNGVGKTTSIAKLARYLEERGHDSVLANGDTFRAGANEQIEEHAENLGVKCISHEQGGDPAAVIYDAVEYAEANDVDVVLGDTAGRLHTSDGLMDQLAKIDRVVDPDLTLFVDEAVAGQDAVNRAREFDDAAAFDGAILTKADADAQGGAAISIAHVTGKPILFLGTGQGYDDLERFDPEWLVDQLLGEE